MAAALVAQPADAASNVLDRIKARGVVHCGGVVRPGLAEIGGDGAWHGLEFDICRAIAVAVLGDKGKVEFAAYGSDAEFARVRVHADKTHADKMQADVTPADKKQADDVSFLTGGEIAAHRLAASVVVGPTVFIESDAVMVAGDSPAQHLADLAGKDICFLSGDTAEHALDQYFESIGDKPWLRHPFSELGEMNDDYAVQGCLGVAGETTTLVDSRLLAGPAKLKSRLLPEAINVFPIVATTGARDARWSAVIAWAVNTLIAADRPDRKWFAGGAGAMPVDGASLGLAPGWQARMLAATGNHAAIFERNLGNGSPYKLAPGINANQLQGGLLLAPFVE